MPQLNSATEANEISSGLFHVSLNQCTPQRKTIVFLHGIFCSHTEFALVTPYLRDYHLMLVDMPAHSRSKDIAPFNPSNSAQHLASLIRAHAHNGQAHVVGLSAGGFVGLQLATEFPEQVSSVWVSGATPFRGMNRWLAAHPGLLYIVIASLFKWMPNWLYCQMCKWAGMLPHDELRAEIQGNFSMELLREGYGSIGDMKLENTMAALAKTGVRTLTVAGEAQDDVAVCRQMGQLLRKGGSKASQAAVAKKALHAWDLQFPELFAKSIRAWIEEKGQPEGIEELK